MSFNPIGLLTIDGADAWTKFGAFRMGTTDDFLKLPTRKKSLQTDYADQDGVSVDLSANYYESRTINLDVLIVGNSQSDFFNKYNAFYSALTAPGQRTVFISQFGQSFTGYYSQNTALTRVTPMNGKVYVKMTVQFVEAVPVVQRANVVQSVYPVANAGNGQIITMPITSGNLDGTQSVAGAGVITTYRWSQVSGPTASIVSPNTATTAITGLTVGTEVFSLTVTNTGGKSSTATVNVVVNPATGGTYTPTGYDASTIAGIDKTGATDSTAAIQAAVKAHPVLYFPTGSYKITKAIILTNNNQIQGSGPTTTLFNWAGGTGANISIFICGNPDNTSSTSNLVLTHFGVISPDEYGLIAFIGYGINNATLSYVNTTKAGLAQIRTQANDGNGLLNINLNCNYCSCVGGPARLSPAVDVLNLNGANISHCDFDGFNNSIICWGGDANPVNLGSTWRTTDVKTCKNITVDSCTGRNQGATYGSSLFFASCVDTILVTNSICYDSLDVGIDFEGCINATARLNTCLNCVNGGISTFYAVDNILFDQNTITGSSGTGADSPGILFRIYGNPSSEGFIKKISLTNNTFNASSNFMARIDARSVCSNLVISGNTFNDSGIQLLRGWNNTQRIYYWNQINISSNIFNFTKAIGDTYLDNAIEVGNAQNGTMTIASNHFNSSVGQSVYAIRTEQADSTAPATIVNSNNNIFSPFFSNQVLAIWGGQNNNILSTVNITGSAGNIQVTRDSNNWGNLEGYARTTAAAGPAIITVNGTTVTGSGTGSGGTADSDLTAFLTATGITDTTQSNAVSALISGLKSNGLWTKIIGLYPMVGGTAARHKVNLKSPGTYDITWNGTLTHNSNGSYSDGTTGYGNTHIVPSVVFGANTGGLSFYSRGRPVSASNGSDMGSASGVHGSTTSGTELTINYGGSYYTGINENNPQLSGTSPTDLNGLFHTTRTSAAYEAVYHRGTLLNSSTFAPDGASTASIWLLGYNPGFYSFFQCAFAAIDTGMSASDAATLSSIVDTFQTSLSRNL